ncbi:hypothetical protein DMUE_0507 [Dictyocoela muelleri]|nr:hypothetical protein DMUE_0507 [Dictyocoela muelleri]
MNYRPRGQALTSHSAPRSKLNKSDLTRHSFYNQLLLWGRISPESVKLNSTRKVIRVKTFDENYTPQKIEFTHTPPNTTISIRRSFSMLEDIQRQDLFKWKNEFIQTVKLAQWNEVTAVEVLRSAIDSQYFNLIDELDTIEKIMKKIFKTKYPESHYIRYLNMLANAKQDDFLTIKEYKEYINDICQRLMICMNWSEEQMNVKAEEAFYTGLSRRTQLEMSRLNVTTIKGIYDMINTTEETLLEQFNGSEVENKLSVYHRNKREEQANKGKRCSYHGLCNHDTAECREIKKNKGLRFKKETGDTATKNLAMSSTSKTPKILEIKTFIFDTEYSAILDTGSSYNYINENIVKKHKLTTKHIKK